MDNNKHIVEFRFVFSRQQMLAFRTGELVKRWAAQYQDLFDGDDLRIHASQPKYHFYEYLAAVLFRETMGYNTLIEKYETASHKEKIARFRTIAGEAVYQNVMANHAGVPDLFVFSSDSTLTKPNWFFCEVKGKGDWLRPHQDERFKQLYQVSKKPVYVLYLAEK